MPRKGQPISAAHRKAIIESNKRRKFTPEMRENYRKAQLGKKLSEEHKQKLSKSLSGEKNPFYGRKHTQETKEKIRQANLGKLGYNLGRHLSDETKEKLRKARLGKPSPMKGRKMPEAAKNKLREAARNRPPISDETRNKLREASLGKNNAFYGKHHSEESKKKIRLAKVGQIPHNLGIEHAEETKDKMKEAWETRRERIGINGIRPETRMLWSIRRTGCGNSFYGKRHTPETKAKMSGPNNHFWKGGRSRNWQYGPEWRSIARQIRMRDGYTCLFCRTKEFGYHKVPSVHHIIPFFDCIEFGICERHSEKNLICLCNKCHRRIESYGLRWVHILRGILSLLYGYEYPHALIASNEKIHPRNSVAPNVSNGPPL